MGDRWWSADTVAVVTGGNKGIGFEIVRRLALEGLTVILTARDVRRGLQSTQHLRSQGLHNVVFRRLDISSEQSVQDFAAWIEDAYGGLDILVNNAAVFRSENSFEGVVETIRINYQGTVDVIEKLLPLFRSSRAGARIVTVSSWAGRLLNVNNEKLRRQLMDESEYDQEFVDETARRYMEACRAGTGQQYANNAYRFSKVLLNAYLRLLHHRLSTQQQHPCKIEVHNAHPGFVHTDMHRQVMQLMDFATYQHHLAQGRFGTEELITVEESVDTPVWLCLVPPAAIPSGLLWSKRQVMSYL